MYLHIEETRSGETLLLRRLAPRELIGECRPYAERYAAQMGFTIAPEGGYVPAGCADIHVQIRTRKHDSVCVWTSESFFIGECE